MLHTIAGLDWARINRWFVVVLFAALGTLASAYTIIVICALVAAVFRLATGLLPWPPRKHVLPLALCFAAYPVAEFLAALANGALAENAVEIIEQLLFLGVVPLLAAYAASKPAEVADALGLGASLGAVFLLAAGVHDLVTVPGLQPAGGAGNATIYSTVGLVLFLVCAAAGMRAAGNRRAIAMAGAMAALGVIVIGGTRAVWVATPPVTLLVLWSYWRVGRLRFPGAPALLAAGFGFSVIAYLAQPLIAARINATRRAMAMLEGGTFESSIGDRIVIWARAWELIRESPVFGYGAAGAIDRLAGMGTAEYSHFHNFAVTALMRGGVVELAAVLAALLCPAALALTAGSGPEAAAGRLLLSGMTLIYLVIGSFGIMFDHDVMNAMFVYVCVIGLFVATGARGRVGA